MNKKSVKLLSLMLSAVMLVVAVPMGVMAASKSGSSVAEGLSSTESASDEVESTTAEPTTKDEAESTTGSVDPDEPTSEVKPTQPAEEESSESASEPVYGLMGDLDGDGKVTAEDARTALRIAARLENPTKKQLEVGDLNKDGKITAKEARAILRYAANLDKVLSVG